MSLFWNEMLRCCRAGLVAVVAWRLPLAGLGLDHELSTRVGSRRSGHGSQRFKGYGRGLRGRYEERKSQKSFIANKMLSSRRRQIIWEHQSTKSMTPNYTKDKDERQERQNRCDIGQPQSSTMYLLSIIVERAA